MSLLLCCPCRPCCPLAEVVVAAGVGAVAKTTRNHLYRFQSSKYWVRHNNYHSHTGKNSCKRALNDNLHSLPDLCHTYNTHH
jgi:hypothetical protein